MPLSKSDLILHPVRLRLLTELAGRSMTSGQLAAAMPDVAQATLYRHIKRLHEGGIFAIVKEEVVNGATERTYAVAAGQGNLTPADVTHLSREEHVRAFGIFAAALVADFSRFVGRTAEAEIATAGASYNRAVIYLTPAERDLFQEEIRALLTSVMGHQPTPERDRYTLASMVIPEERSQNESNSS